MNNDVSARSGRPVTLAVVFGLVSVTLFSLLYAFEDALIAFAGRGGWYFLVPVTTAFAFSYVHGSFTAHFWDCLGIKARK